MHRIIAAAIVLAALPLVAVSSHTAAREGAIFPDTDAGRRAEGYFRAFNSADENDMEAYLRDNFPAESFTDRPLEQRMAMYRGIKKDLVSLEAVKIIREREDEVTVVARSGTGRWLELRFGFEERAPHLVAGIRIMPLDEPPDLDEPTTPLTEAQALSELADYLDAAVGKDEFSGVVLVARGMEPVFRRAYGPASREFDVPNRVDTRFNVGSINKFITRIAIEQLAAKGALALDDAIGKHLADYPNRQAAEKVTIRHLLEMSSGLGDFFNEHYDATPKNRIRTLADYLPLFADEPLAFEPGTNRRYSNAGYIVLGLIIETVSGRSYYDYVRDEIYAVAGMDDTEHIEADIPAPNVASGYSKDRNMDGTPDGDLRSNLYTRPARGSSAGGGYSTADDLLKLILALDEDRLSAGAVSKMVAEEGFAIAGGAPGINAVVQRHPDGDYVVIVLANLDPPAAQRVARTIESLLGRVE